MPDRITKPMQRVLERALAKEIERAFGPKSMSNFPIQLGKTKAVRECVEAGLLEPREHIDFQCGVLFRFSGHELTHAGRFAYCAKPDA